MNTSITASITALGNRVTALEEGMDGYTTDEEAATAASNAVTNATASDEEVNTCWVRSSAANGLMPTVPGRGAILSPATISGGEITVG